MFIILQYTVLKTHTFMSTLNDPSFSLSADMVSTVRTKSHAALSPSNHCQGQPPPGSADSVWRWQRLYFLSLQVLYFWTEWTAGGHWERGQLTLALVYSAQRAIPSALADSQLQTLTKWNDDAMP